MIYHHTKNKADIGAAAVKLDLIKKGYIVLIPETEHAPFDFVVYNDNCFLRIQSKYRKISSRNLITIKSSTSWADKNGNHRKAYDKNQIDCFAIYCPNTDECYYLTPQVFNMEISLRISETKNNQEKGVHYTKDFKEPNFVTPTGFKPVT